jgi:hypothetical protein
MDDKDRVEPVADAGAEEQHGETAGEGLTPKDEEILLKRLRELGYVE